MDFRDGLRGLVEILSTLPIMADYETRSTLLAGLPGSAAATIRRSNAPLVDISNIVETVASWGRLASGEHALIGLLRNAAALGAGTELETRLQLLAPSLAMGEGRLSSTPIASQEVVIGRDDRVSVAFLEGAIRAVRAVARLQVPRMMNGKARAEHVCGTGWLVTDDLLVTCHHVIEARFPGEPRASATDLAQQAKGTRCSFGCDEETSLPVAYETDRLEHYDSETDSAILRVNREPAGGTGTALTSWGVLSVISAPMAPLKGTRLNVIQHPRCREKKIALRSNFLVDDKLTSEGIRLLRYLSDTEPGSSGAPVMDDSWQVVGLHHGATPVLGPIPLKGGSSTYSNECTEIHSVLSRLPDSLRDEIAGGQGWP